MFHFSDLMQGGGSHFYSSKDFSENWHITPPGGLVLGGNVKFRFPPFFPPRGGKNLKFGHSEGQILPVASRIGQNRGFSSWLTMEFEITPKVRP